MSVIIPTYNRSAFIGRAVRSVMNAARPGDEIIVVDDGSTDSTEEALRPFGGAIRYFRIENRGPGAARNYGVCMAECPLVAFLDSDDEWMRDKLELQRAVMQRFPELVLCFSNVCSKRPNGQVGHDQLSMWRTDIRLGSDHAPAHLSGYLGTGLPFSSFAPLPDGRADFNVHIGDLYLPQMEVFCVYSDTVMVRKALAGALLRFPEDIRLMEDWECYARVARAGPAAYLDCELAIQHVHAEPRLTTEADDLTYATGRLLVLRRVWGADPEFLRMHAERYQRVLKAQQVYRAKLLLQSGRMSEARQDLKEVGGPWAYSVLASLPSALVSGAFRVRKGLKGLLTSS